MSKINKLAASMAEFDRWMNSPLIDAQTKAELKTLDGNPLEIVDRFGRELEFGTAGLRGVMRAGINAMNVYVIMRATQGLANYINECGVKESNAKKEIAIVYDSRLNSYTFAKTTAQVLAANGIKVKMYKILRPTPVASYCVRHFGIIGAIAITASHNPKNYNGYKVFWDDGAQISSAQAEVISGYITNVDIFSDLELVSFDVAVSDGRIELLDEECDEGYIDSVMEQRLDWDIYRRTDLCVVHTPLHGASWKLVPDVLHRCGISDVYSVEEQLIPDGNFPTVPKPNPEYDAVYPLAINLAKRMNADIIIANDPDSDRIGVVIKQGNDYKRLTGNQTGALLLEYLLSHRKDCNNTFAVKTLVSTELATRICESYGCEISSCLTGFKNIGAVVNYHEEHNPEKQFVLGFEESYGYLKGNYARDKDGVVAAMLVCEMAAKYKEEGKTLIDVLNEIYERYGYYGEQTYNIEFTGTDADERRERLMKKLRAKSPDSMLGYKVEKITDYLYGDTVKGTDLEMVENVLYYNLEGGNVIVVRPSGTEPKVKVYLMLNGKRSEIEKLFAKGGEGEEFSEMLRALAY